MRCFPNSQFRNKKGKRSGSEAGLKSASGKRVIGMMGANNTIRCLVDTARDQRQRPLPLRPSMYESTVRSIQWPHCDCLGRDATSVTAE